METAMQRHLEWLKTRIYISPQMEEALLHEEKQQIIEVLMQVDCDLKRSSATKYFNEIFKQD